MVQLPKHRHSRWHAGEKLLQRRVGASDRMEAMGQKVIRDYMPDQHREFYHQLPFMVVGAVAAGGRPWATLLEGPQGFVSSPDPRSLALEVLLDPQDPATPGLQAGDAIGLLGIELHTRRRNRINGLINSAKDGCLQVSVEHAFGNCPQYIQKRTWSWAPNGVDGKPPRQDFPGLDPRSAQIIGAADTFFVASYMQHDDGQRSVDVSHRGGRPGFVKVDGDLLTIPDYAGNLHFNTLGNLQLNAQAGLLFVDFNSGDVLQLSGHTELILESPLIAAFEGAERLWTFKVQQVVLRPAAVALRWGFEEFAPTSLMTGTWQEAQQRLDHSEQRRQWQDWQVVGRAQETPDILSLVIQPRDGAAVAFLPGQHVPVRLAAGSGEALIRTYSVSSAPSDGYVRISVKAQGPASRFLHEQVRVGDTLQVRAPLGSFTLASEAERPVVLIGAGVGVTPLISMARELVGQLERQQRQARVYLFQSARTLQQLPFQAELQALVQRAAGRFQVLRALSNPAADTLPGEGYELAGRLGFKQVQARLGLDDYDFYLCGPASFTQDMYDGLHAINVPDARIHAETFGPSTLRRSAQVLGPVPAQLPAATAAVPVYFAESAKEARWAPHSGSLLELAESRGLNPDFSCRGGSCGTCAVRLASGNVHYTTPPAQWPDEGMVLICCAVPAVDESGINPLVLEL